MRAPFNGGPIQAKLGNTKYEIREGHGVICEIVRDNGVESFFHVPQSLLDAYAARRIMQIEASKARVAMESIGMEVPRL